MAEDVKKLHRSRTDRMIAGICGGLGEMFSIDPTLVRLVFALVALFTVGTAALVYILGWVIIPEAPAE
ncbi:MAG: PspC domain-containing protein [Candidatus Dadabacteria bacterium RIFCSPHIGHO2_12_FULL_53_21]|jgi:phage shock protein PspC (stress-responsive transcriptional regulator)|nr:MAG: PspC domain-containing protein [Candidatus Dadabacteria bacterium RIFCSPHIGHO2_12_FULL_53_21]